MRPGRHTLTLALTLPLALALAGCAGALDFTAGAGGDSVDAGAPEPDLGAASMADLTSGEGSGKVVGDSGAPADAALSADALSPDALQPDQLAPDLTTPDKGFATAGAGGPCPCKSGLVCINNVCRAQCAAPTGACKVKSVCASGQGCVGIQGAPTIFVCIPAAGPGQACTGKPCVTNHVCGIIGKNAPVCLPTCSNKGKLCGKGGICVQDSKSSCTFCTQPN